MADVTAPTAVIKGVRGKLFRDGDHPVYVLEDGRFAVRWQANWEVKKTLAAIDKLFAVREKRTQKPLRLIDCRYSDAEPYDVVDVVGQKLLLANGTKRYSYWSGTYVYNPELVEKLKKFREREKKIKEELDREEAAILAQMRKVSFREIPGLLKELAE